MSALLRALGNDMAAIFGTGELVSDQARAAIEWDHRFAHSQGEHPDAHRLSYRSNPDAEQRPECVTCGEIFDGEPDTEECECCVAEGRLAYMREHDARAER